MGNGQYGHGIWSIGLGLRCQERAVQYLSPRLWSEVWSSLDSCLELERSGPAPAPSSAIIMGADNISTMQGDPGYIQWPLVESQMKRAWMNVFAFVKRRRIEAEVEEVGPLNLCYAANTNLVTGDFLRLCDIWLLVWLFMLWPWQCDYGMTCKDILWQWGVLSVLLLLLYKIVMSKISLQTSKIFGKRRRSEYNWNPDGLLN